MKNIFLVFRDALSSLFRRNVVERPQVKQKSKSAKIVTTVDIRDALQKISVNKTNIQVEKKIPQISDDEYLKISNQLMNSSTNEEYVILPFEDIRLLNLFTKKYQPDMFKYVLKRLNVAVRSNLPYVTIFQFGKTSGIARISSENYEKQLKTLLNFFVRVENYESASVCRDLIRQLHNNVKVE